MKHGRNVMIRPIITRRALLARAAGIAGGLVAPAIWMPRMSFAAAAAGEARFVLVLLRGALDGLAAAPPVGDPGYARLRGELALGNGGVLHPLDELFALHPALEFMAEQWAEKHMTLLHAVATPYRERSHFDAQDVLESGYSRAHAAQSGWLNRALAGLPRPVGGSKPQQEGVVLGAGVPLVMRGPAEVASWAPSRLPRMEDDTLERLADLYTHDALLARRLAEALAAQEMAGGPEGMGGAGRGSAAQFAQAARTAAGFLVREDGPRVAVLETSGWDTHANQGSEQGALAVRLGALDNGLRSLRTGLGAAWKHTVVLVATEFGRTVAANGTRGTDHGTGAAAFLVGGAVRGRVVADWPGLAAGALYEGRDLAPTLDLRAVAAAVLQDHLGIERAFIAREVFPDGTSLRHIDGLVG
jgi:uncharacterized protein (DUF1501 family)